MKTFKSEKENFKDDDIEIVLKKKSHVYNYTDLFVILYF